jgi:hypothetical protein
MCDVILTAGTAVRRMGWAPEIADWPTADSRKRLPRTPSDRRNALRARGERRIRGRRTITAFVEPVFAKNLLDLNAHKYTCICMYIRVHVLLRNVHAHSCTRVDCVFYVNGRSGKYTHQTAVLTKNADLSVV